MGLSKNFVIILLSLFYVQLNSFAFDLSLFSSEPDKSKVKKEQKNLIINYQTKNKKKSKVKKVKTSKDLIKKSEISIVSVSSEESVPKALNYFFLIGNYSYKNFKIEIVKDKLLLSDLDFFFLKEKKKHLQRFLKSDDLDQYTFYALTKAVSLYLAELKDNYLVLSQNVVLRNKLQQIAYGLSLSIKKSNELNLNINSDHFSKLHDLLLSQSTALFYSADQAINMRDIFWQSYFLSQLQYPMDLVNVHFKQLDRTLHHFPTDVFFENYKGQMAKYSIVHSIALNKVELSDLELIFSYAQTQAHSVDELSSIQKSYLRQLSQIGATESLKKYKKLLASNILLSEGKKIVNDFSFYKLLKYSQIVIGYIFVVWPLEWILIVVSLTIFFFQFNVVIVDETQKKKNVLQKLWIMFTRSYLGSNVPFFSKLAASLILFGIGLYFNSAKSFLETLMN